MTSLAKPETQQRLAHANRASVAGGLLDREELLRQLERAVTKRVTVISAPPGSGKTSLLRAWVDRPANLHRVAFVSVERDLHSAQRNPTGGAAISQGAIRLNGLEIIPDAGVKIVIDPRQHTINTTGDVRIVLRAPVIGDITIYHGELHVDLAGSLADAGSTLFDFDTSQFPVSLEGFPIDSSLTVKLTHDGVTIPISLKLPSYMGGVSGQATLIADNATGLHVSSLHIGVADLNLGALEIKDLAVDYTAQGTVWKGAATVEIPGGSGYFEISAQVEFDHDDLTMGSFQVGVPFPGSRSSPTSTSTASVAASTCTRPASGSSGRSTSARSRSTRPTTRSMSPARSR
jgi:hypothetical protein